MRILLVDSNSSDIELAAAVLKRDFPGAEILSAGDSVSLATAITRSAIDVALVEPRLSWAAADKVLNLIKRESPRTAIVLFGHESDIVERCLHPGRALSGVVRKNSAGFVALGAIVRDAMAAGEDQAGITIEALPAAGFFADDDGRVTSTNTAFSALAFSQDEVPPPASIEALCADHQAALAWRGFLTGDARHTEVRLRLADGRIHLASVARDTGRRPERRFLGLLLATQATEINIVNSQGRDQSSREMHDIALVFSHDLKEPVQQIMRLLRRLDEPARGDEPGAANKLTQQLHTCAERASAMLDGMLEYLAVSARDERPGLTDLNECLAQALDNMRATIEESDAEVTSNKLPVVAGDAYQLLHLFQNLIGNAIKFRGRERPRLRIEASSTNERWRIAFRDNGIGIAEQFRERVFDMGKRLHTREEYAGGGIGLTLCRRIVERHGGSIRIDAGDNGGSTVIVEFPRASGHVARLA